MYRAVRSKIEEQRLWVMIIDNADDLTIFGQHPADGGGRPLEANPLNLMDFVPRGSNGTILWTSRDAHVSEIVGPEQAINVGPMSSEQATCLLAKNLRPAAGRGSRARPADAETAAGRQLVEDLGFLPLAISQAGAYIRNTRTDIPTYLAALQDRDRRQNVLADVQDDRHRQSATFNSVFRSLGISIKHFQDNDPIACHVLSVIAFVHRQNIPLEFLKVAVHGTISPVDASVLTDTVTMHTTQAVARLQDFSFLEEVKNSNSATLYEIHELLQEAVRFHLRMRKCLARTLPTPLVAKVFKCGCSSELCHLVTTRDYQNFEEAFAYEAFLVLLVLLQTFEHATSLDSPQVNVFRTLTTHAKVVTDNADTCHTRGTSCCIHVEVLESLASTLDKVGMWQEGEGVAQRLLGYASKKHGPKHIITLNRMILLAQIYFRQFRLEDAEKLGRASLALCLELHLDDWDEMIASVRQLLIDILACRGQLNQRKEAFELTGSNLCRIARSPETAESDGYLAEMVLKTGWVDGAVLHAEAAWRTCRRTRGDIHLDTVDALLRLVKIYCQQTRYNEAENMARQAMAATSALLHSSHPKRISTMVVLGEVIGQQKRHEEALTILTEALKISRQDLGLTHLMTITCAVVTADELIKMNRLAEAERIASELDITTPTWLAEENLGTLEIKQKLGSIFCCLGRFEEGLELLQKCLSVAERILDPDSKRIKQIKEVQETFKKRRDEVNSGRNADGV